MANNNILKQKLRFSFFSFPTGSFFGYWLWTLVLYSSGLLLWSEFLNWGKIDFNIHDWYEITGPRLYFLKNAIMQGVLPLHMPGTSALVLLTDRYLSIPDQILSPQVLLLRWIEPAQFVLINWLFLYSLGFLGLLLFTRRFKLSPFVFTVLFLLFNFNGHIESHLGIGHYTWGGYFLLPWFVMLALDLQKEQIGWRWIGQVSGLLFLIFLQGSFHQFVALLIFIACLGLSFTKHFWQLLLSGLMACLLGAVRIFPVALIINGVQQEFLGGFWGLHELLNGMVVLYPADAVVPNGVHSIYAWELDFYIGIPGLAFIVIFGFIYWLKNRSISLRYLLPVVILFLFSLGETYGLVRFFSIPLFNGERVTTRFLILPMVFLIFLAGVYCQKWLDGTAGKPIYKLLLIAGLLVLTWDLWIHFDAWKMDNLVLLFKQNLYHFKPGDWIIANYTDSLYTGVLKRSLLVTLASAAWVCITAIFNLPTAFFWNPIQNIFHRWIKPS